MKPVPYPRSFEVGSTWHEGYEHPKGFVAALKTRFPNWKDLHRYLDRHDKSVWEMLRLYQERLSEVKASEILKAHKMGKIEEVIRRLREASNLDRWFNSLERRHFPEVIAQRERRRRERESASGWD